MAPNHSDPVSPKYQWVAGNPQPCQVCTVNIWDAAHWISHMKTHKEELELSDSDKRRYKARYRCPLCKQTSNAWWRLKDHFARHFLGCKPYQCTEMIPVVDPEARNSTGTRVERCPHREVDPSRLNVHRVRRHGHQPQPRVPKASNDISNSGQATRSSSSDRRAAHNLKSSPYSKSYPSPRTRRAAQLERHAASDDFSSPSSSKLAPDMPRYPGNYNAEPNLNCATPEYSLAPLPASYGAKFGGATLDYSLDLSPASTSSPLSFSTYSTPQPTDFGLGVTYPSPSPSPSYPWSTPLPQSSYMATSSPPTTGLSIGAYANEGPSWDSLDLWLSGLSREAKQTIDREMEIFARTLGL
ncbi:hypothetical protein PHLGIDRAFT_229557 [Phlebiopsis gigantea 11061_1 CR5-6]|uniref:C2H2-type domain-containing protein n=1 Tax=Phlebiopsis gigantea (strain 11061_1 CR5-6) TaxID=745531 RepID=A0A0C3S264_PHLG1|nr:hypothetical protein PHLGIDRAFT_229557 [Phlebiopsis gigantea 11061_1 CR5-6]